MDFYPRSPCGERPYSQHVTRPSGYFYPRSPCGERPKAAAASACFATFLSTLSLRRATQTQGLKIPALCISIHALLAESDVIARWSFHGLDISIHALLAESDPLLPVSILISLISIHALLAESDWLLTSISTSRRYFYPRSPCGERRVFNLFANPGSTISIHALLAESDA